MAVAALQEGDRIIAPQPGPQEGFLSTPADIAIFGGAAGGGKTVGLMMEPLRHKAVSGFRAVFFRRTYPRIIKAGAMWDESEELYEGLAEPVKGDLYWRFPSGARFEFSHMQREKDRLDFKGAQIPYLGWDQLEEFTEKQFWYLQSRNRSTCGVRPYTRATCNPVPEDDEVGGWLHRLISWWLDEESGYPIQERSGVIRWFVREGEDLVWADDPEELDKKYPDLAPQSLTFIPATLEDNPLLEKADPGYRGKLLSLPRVERERLLGGNWKVRPSAGDYFQRSWFSVVDTPPAGGETVRAWDLAATEKEREKDDPDWTVGLKISRLDDGRFVVRHMERFRKSPGGTRDAVENLAGVDGKEVAIRLPQDPAQAGKSQAKDFVTRLAGYTVTTKPVTGSKTVRAGPASSQAEAGNIIVERGPWNEPFFRELERFPDGGHDDIVDALSDGIDELTSEKRKVRWSVR